MNNTLQHTATTHCNYTLQHTAALQSPGFCGNLVVFLLKGLEPRVTEKNHLRYTATRCSTLQHAATRCNTLQRTATHSIERPRVESH